MASFGEQMLKTGISINRGVQKRIRIDNFMQIHLTVLALGLSLLPFKAKAQSWDFQYSYQDVFASNAQEYVVQQQNIATVNEGDGISYWCPITNGAEAILTQEFTFPQPTTQIYLLASLSSFNFGAGEYGSGSLWGATDGTNWIQLENAPTPAGQGYG
jgi:hypothetical protein